jgi:hypothetical protein
MSSIFYILINIHYIPGENSKTGNLFSDSRPIVLFPQLYRQNSKPTLLIIHNFRDFWFQTFTEEKLLDTAIMLFSTIFYTSGLKI